MKKANSHLTYFLIGLAFLFLGLQHQNACLAISLAFFAISITQLRPSGK